MSLRANIEHLAIAQGPQPAQTFPRAILATASIGQRHIRQEKKLADRSYVAQVDPLNILSSVHSQVPWAPGLIGQIARSIAVNISNKGR